MEEKGLESLIKKLGVKNFKELHKYIHSEEHKNEKKEQVYNNTSFDFERA